MVTLKGTIKGFARKGLEDLFYDRTTKGVQHKYVGKMLDILDLLANADISQNTLRYRQ